ncbi:hydrogenase 3 maturation endopeptidase HyCI [Candidatus Omnitrophota bacterium]
MNHELKDILKGKVVIVGIGNILRGDDGFGPALIENLKPVIKAICIDVGTAPENYAGKIAKEDPDTILIVDAVDLDLAPGEFDIIRKDEILETGFTTHDMSPKMFIGFLESETRADIFMLGLQPKSINFGDDMSNIIKESLETISAKIKEALNA